MGSKENRMTAHCLNVFTKKRDVLEIKLANFVSYLNYYFTHSRCINFLVTILDLNSKEILFTLKPVNEKSSGKKWQM